MTKKLNIAKKACLDSRTGKIYYKCEIDGEDIYATLTSNNVAHDAVGAIVSAIDDPEKTAVTEVEIEEEDIPIIACSVGDYYWDCLCNGNLSDADAEDLEHARDAAMEGMSIEGWGTLGEVRDRINEMAMWHDIEQGIWDHAAELEIVHDYSKDEDEACAPSRWTSDPEYKYEHTHAYAWPNLLAKAAEIREKHPEGATGQWDEDGWILFLQHEADQAAEELGFDMNDFYENYAKKRGFMVLENTAGPYHIKPYDFSLSGDPVPDSWPY